MAGLFKLRVTSYKLQVISCCLFFGFFFSFVNVNAAYLKDIPTEVVQPNGDTLHCYASGDEFFNYLHDKEGYTIIQNKEGYYMYATYAGEQIVPSQYRAGTVNPATVGLQPNVTISTQEYHKRRAEWFNYEDIPRAKTPGVNHGKINNLVVFIKFADQTDITRRFSIVDSMYNSQAPGGNSMSNYFNTTSYGHFNIQSYFFPEPEGEQIFAFIDEHPRDYYRPFDSVTNVIGYPETNNERRKREHELLRNAIAYIAEMVPQSLNLDYNNDGYVDNVCFVIRGGTTAWSSLLWPHRWSLSTEEAYIHGKRVWDYNFMLEGASSYFNNAVLSHEMQHSLEYPDLYHYSYNGPTPVGNWDIMESNPNPPQQSGGYMKWKYGNWLDEPVSIQPGKYTLNSIGSGLGFVSYKIPSYYDSRQYFVLEFRNATDRFDRCYTNGTGMLIYRINTKWNGNADYNPDRGIYDEVYLFRPGGNSPTQDGTISLAHFGVSERTTFDANSNPKPFLTDGTYVDNLSITDITVDFEKNKVSFTYNGGTTQYVSVAFHPNGTEGKTSPQMFEAHVPQTLRPNGFSLQGRVFKGWALEPDDDVVYSNNQAITIDEDIVLYPVFYPLGIKENEITNSLFTLQPNPANNYLEIVLSNEALTMQGVTAQIYNIQGMLLKTLQLYNEKTQIDISDLAKGIYVVKVGYEVKKLIVR